MTSRKRTTTAPPHVLDQLEGYHPDDRRFDADQPRLRLVDEELTFLPLPAEYDEGSRSTTWDRATHGPEPRPDWVITDLGASDTELGIVKTGKEADVFLLERRSQDGNRASLMAAKRYRSREHRQFHRDSSYQEGRRVRRSRERRAMANRTTFGRDLLTGQWSFMEFEILSRLWTEGVPVPYPVQLDEAEIMMEFIGTDREAAPRLAALRPDPDQLDDLWEQAHDAIRHLARLGFAHGDLSPYNILVHDGRLHLIDLPQVVDVVVNPQGAEFLHRDVVNLVDWFVRRGLDELDPENVFVEMAMEANLF